MMKDLKFQLRKNKMGGVRYNSNTLGNFRVAQDAGLNPATSLPKIPLLHTVVSNELMFIDTCDSIRFKWAFQQCRDFRG